MKRILIITSILLGALFCISSFAMTYDTTSTATPSATAGKVSQYINCARPKHAADKSVWLAYNRQGKRTAEFDKLCKSGPTVGKTATGVSNTIFVGKRKLTFCLMGTCDDDGGCINPLYSNCYHGCCHH